MISMSIYSVYLYDIYGNNQFFHFFILVGYSIEAGISVANAHLQL